MDATAISALAGLAGAVIGGATSVISSMLAERLKDRSKSLEGARTRKERLYIEFIAEASRLFGDALSNQKDDPSTLVQLYALVARMRLGSCDEVVEAAESVTIKVQNAYTAPTRSLRELHIFSKDGGSDPLFEFSKACRRELERRIG